jgi:hypothetical protein
MAVLRPHLALTVTDVARAIPFYEALFGEMDTSCCYAGGLAVDEGVCCA